MPKRTHRQPERELQVSAAVTDARKAEMRDVALQLLPRRLPEGEPLEIQSSGFELSSISRFSSGGRSFISKGGELARVDLTEGEAVQVTDLVRQFNVELLGAGVDMAVLKRVGPVQGKAGWFVDIVQEEVCGPTVAELFARPRLAENARKALFLGLVDQAHLTSHWTPGSLKLSDPKYHWNELNAWIPVDEKLENSCVFPRDDPKLAAKLRDMKPGRRAKFMATQLKRGVPASVRYLDLFWPTVRSRETGEMALTEDTDLCGKVTAADPTFWYNEYKFGTKWAVQVKVMLESIAKLPFKGKRAEEFVGWMQSAMLEYLNGKGATETAAWVGERFRMGYRTYLQHVGRDERKRFSASPMLAPLIKAAEVPEIKPVGPSGPPTLPGWEVETAVSADFPQAATDADLIIPKPGRWHKRF